MNVAQGIWPPAATPFRADLSIDFDRYIAHCRRLLADGAHGLAVLGTTSEANSLEIAERETVLERLVAAGIAADKLLPGTGATSLGDAVRLTGHALDLGVRGVLLLPPFYYKGVSDDGLFAFVSALIERIGSDRLKLYLYNFPQMTGIVWSVALVGRLRDAFPGIVAGLKDSSGDVAYMDKLLESYPGFAVFPSSEALLLAALRKGAAGCISATANTHVIEIRGLFDRWQDSNAAMLHERVAAVRRLVQSYPLIPAVKAILAARDNANDWLRVRPPLDPLAAGSRDELLAALAKLQGAAVLASA
ncbi:MAG TPA: dihydrodipicolinate synthase family protein [Xanthobacteraceae bacterium]|nr:dihydrodipicolinate synthase family protein [Xanthobacteraceae bacterium]